MATATLAVTSWSTESVSNSRGLLIHSTSNTTIQTVTRESSVTGNRCRLINHSNDAIVAEADAVGNTATLNGAIIASTQYRLTWGTNTGAVGDDGVAYNARNATVSSAFPQTSGIIVFEETCAENGATPFNGANSVSLTYTAAPTAAFTGTPLTGTSNITTVFTDQSTATPTSWAWYKKLGTGSYEIFSTAQSPTHTFTQGSWSIKLTATNGTGSDDEEKVAYILVSPFFKTTNSAGGPQSKTITNDDAYTLVLPNSGVEDYIKKGYKYIKDPRSY